MASPYQGQVRFATLHGSILRGTNEPAYYGRGIGRCPRGAGTHGGNRVLHPRFQAVRAIEDLQWIPPAVTTLHKKIAAGAPSARPQPYLPPAGLVILVDNASKSIRTPPRNPCPSMLSMRRGGGHYPSCGCRTFGVYSVLE